MWRPKEYNVLVNCLATFAVIMLLDKIHNDLFCKLSTISKKLRKKINKIKKIKIMPNTKEDRHGHS